MEDVHFLSKKPISGPQNIMMANHVRQGTYLDKLQAQKRDAADNRYERCEDDDYVKIDGKYKVKHEVEGAPAEYTEYTAEEMNFEKAFAIKANNGIKLWSLAVDVRQTKDEALSECGLRDCDMATWEKWQEDQEDPEAPSTKCAWPSDDLLHSSQEGPLTEEQAEQLMKTDFAKVLAGGDRSRFGDYCIPVICERSRAKDSKRDSNRDSNRWINFAKKERSEEWFLRVSSGEASVLSLDKAFQALDKLKEPLRQSLEGFQIPHIVMVGSTSVGKSTVLRRFTQFPFFPSGDGICTRLPIKVQVRKLEGTGDSFAKMSVHDVVEATQTVSEDSDHIEEIRLEDAMGKVQEKMENLVKEKIDSGLDEHGMVMNKELRIQVFSNDFPLVNLVDLPGIVTAIGPEDARSKMAKHSLTLFKRYVKDGSSLILCIFQATDPPDRWDSVHLIEGMDKQNPNELQKLAPRSMGIVTKCDLLRTKTQKENLEKLLTGATQISLGLGYCAVAQDETVAGGRAEVLVSDSAHISDSDSGPFREIDQKEQDIFSSFKTDASRLSSIKIIRKKISDAYLNQVFESWLPIAFAKLLEAWSINATQGDRKAMETCDKAFQKLEAMYKEYKGSHEGSPALTLEELSSIPFGTISGVPPSHGGPCRKILEELWKAVKPLKTCTLSSLEDSLRLTSWLSASFDFRVAQKVNEAVKDIESKSIDELHSAMKSLQQFDGVETKIESWELWNDAKNRLEALEKVVYEVKKCNLKGLPVCLQILQPLRDFRFGIIAAGGEVDKVGSLVLEETLHGLELSVAVESCLLLWVDAVLFLGKAFKDAGKRSIEDMHSAMEKIDNSWNLWNDAKKILEAWVSGDTNTWGWT
eukprot:Skav221163  [mRNA]  locus=scaffold85:221413:228298:- [translate_table: standard]